MNDDLNMPKALSVFLKALDDFDFSPKKKLKLLEKLDSILGLKIKDFKEEKVSISAELKFLIAEREKYRKARDFAKADIVRERIKELGFTIQDTSDGPKLNKI